MLDQGEGCWQSRSQDRTQISRTGVAARQQHDGGRRPESIHEFSKITILGDKNSVRVARSMKNRAIGRAGQALVTHDKTLMPKLGCNPTRKRWGKMIVEPYDHAVITG